ncbi:MAG: metallopeptidase family protein [Propionibacteriaceae bacterium]|jgi:predicted Zn-dependent protease with MMP-like domain|nr:metallopeptidase family protein [Propionibacteriaceae bacterium]
MAVSISDDEFDILVGEALDEIPEEFWEKVDNVVVQVQDLPEDGSRNILGLYEGIPLSERDSWYAGVLPDIVWIFRTPLKAMARDEDDLREQIGITVVHEIGHFFGLDDHHLEELGWG